VVKFVENYLGYMLLSIDFGYGTVWSENKKLFPKFNLFLCIFNGCSKYKHRVNLVSH